MDLNGVDVRYPLIIASAILVCAWMLHQNQRGLPLKPEEKIAIGLGAFCGAMIGAKLPFALADWPGLVSGAVWFSNGKTIMCGMVGAYFGVELAKWIVDTRVKTGDSFAAPVAMGVGIGRIGCLVAGCCYGLPTTLPWGVSFATADRLDPAHAALPRHPTQLYETAFHFAMAFILTRLRNRQIWTGQLAKLYILSYLGYRFLTEYIRPEARFAGGLTGYQYAALLMAPVFGYLWYRDTRKSAPPPTPNVARI